MGLTFVIRLEIADNIAIRVDDIMRAYGCGDMGISVFILCMGYRPIKSGDNIAGFIDNSPVFMIVNIIKYPGTVIAKWFHISNICGYILFC